VLSARMIHVTAPLLSPRDPGSPLTPSKHDGKAAAASLHLAAYNSVLHSFRPFLPSSLPPAPLHLFLPSAFRSSAYRLPASAALHFVLQSTLTSTPTRRGCKPDRGEGGADRVVLSGGNAGRSSRTGRE